MLKKKYYIIWADGVLCTPHPASPKTDIANLKIFTLSQTFFRLLHIVQKLCHIWYFQNAKYNNAFHKMLDAMLPSEYTISFYAHQNQTCTNNVMNSKSAYINKDFSNYENNLRASSPYFRIKIFSPFVLFIVWSKSWTCACANMDMYYIEVRLFTFFKMLQNTRAKFGLLSLIGSRSPLWKRK